MNSKASSISAMSSLRKPDLCKHITDEDLSEKRLHLYNQEGIVKITVTGGDEVRLLINNKFNSIVG